MEGIESFGFKTMTNVQKESIPYLLAKQDVWGTARAGSGKTLAFLIPSVEMVKDCKGISCVILSPTRELIMQTSSVLEKLAAPHGLKQTAFIGGVKISTERETLKSGVNIVLATPGRLVDHIKHTSDFLLSSVKVLVIDEADRMMDIRFEEDMKTIMHHIKGKRKTPYVTMLFSATKSKKLEDLSSKILRENFKIVDLSMQSKTGASTGDKSTLKLAAEDHKTAADKLTHTYLECCIFQRFIVLYKLLSENTDKKTMVFINTCDGVNFYKRLLGLLGITVLAIQGRQGQQIRYQNYQEFVAASCGALLCTDVAARGWDIPAVDLIVQFDPPQSIQEYIHRVGRAARRVGERGEAVLFVRREELGILQELKKEGIDVHQFQGVDMYDLDYDVQTKVEGIVAEDKALQTMGTAAYRNYLTSYVVLKPQYIYDRHTIDLKELSKNFGLKFPPAFNFSRTPLSAPVKGIFHKPRKERTGLLESVKYAGGGNIFSIAPGKDLTEKILASEQKRVGKKKTNKNKKAKTTETGTKMMEVKDRARKNEMTGAKAGKLEKQTPKKEGSGGETSKLEKQPFKNGVKKERSSENDTKKRKSEEQKSAPPKKKFKKNKVVTEP
ncbi:hypothetical protein HAZT_HAZT003006 [Hyalella azteca]|nr:hypothetical protein HAZT_HAZT003006 [Hyalella azteca]